MTVEDFNQVIAARIDNNFGRFKDRSENSYSLEVLNASTREALQRGRVSIRIEPNGNDTWRFGFFLKLIFSDNSSLQGGANNLSLNEDRQQQSFGLQGMLR